MTIDSPSQDLSNWPIKVHQDRQIFASISGWLVTKLNSKNLAATHSKSVTKKKNTAKLFYLTKSKAQIGIPVPS